MLIKTLYTDQTSNTFWSYNIIHNFSQLMANQSTRAVDHQQTHCGLGGKGGLHTMYYMGMLHIRLDNQPLFGK